MISGHSYIQNQVKLKIYLNKSEFICPFEEDDEDEDEYKHNSNENYYKNININEVLHFIFLYKEAIQIPHYLNVSKKKMFEFLSELKDNNTIGIIQKLGYPVFPNHQILTFNSLGFLSKLYEINYRARFQLQIYFDPETGLVLSILMNLDWNDHSAARIFH